MRAGGEVHKEIKGERVKRQRGKERDEMSSEKNRAKVAA